jgi:hypothetical protein
MTDDLRPWQRDLLTPNARGLMFDQVVAELLGVKKVMLRDGEWRVEYFGGTLGGTVYDVMYAIEDSIKARALEGRQSELTMTQEKCGHGPLTEEGYCPLCGADLRPEETTHA